MKPKVSIIITTFLPENKRYLDVCIKSIENLDYPKESLEVVIVGKDSYRPEYPGCLTVYTQDDRHTAQGINCGVKNSSPDSKYIWYLNDDVIVTKDALTHLVMAVGDSAIVANGISPCDNYLNYQLMFAFDKDNQRHFLNERFYTYEDLEQYFPDLMNAESLYFHGMLLQPWLCMYATFIPRFIWDKVGPMDENFKTGQCDIDYSYRCHLAGAQTVSALNSLIWHFGGRTSEKTLNDPIRRANIQYFHKKWGRMPPGLLEKDWLD